MEGLRGKIMLLLAAFVVLVAGGVWWSGSPAGEELSAGHVSVRSESVSDGTFRWSFEAADSQGRPLETVFYTEEWTPVSGGGAVEVTVRLFDSPAEGRTPLNRVSLDSSASAGFVLTCVRPAGLSRQYPDASYRIRFCGRNLGTWRAGTVRVFS